MTAQRGSVRRQVRIARAPDDVWAIVGDPGRVQEWFPGIVSSTVDGNEPGHRDRERSADA